MRDPDAGLPLAGNRAAGAVPALADETEFGRIKSIYNFVRDEILFGYNSGDELPASKVLSDGFGQCNTKGTLFMALLRSCSVPCRIHGFTIDKKPQKGAMTGIVYAGAPGDIPFLGGSIAGRRVV